ncbi:MAG: carbon-nitrogen family hydrolase, partial [Anaerolineae bacterium]
MKVGLIQMDVAFGDPQANRVKAVEMAERAVREDVDVLVLPEMWNTGYSLANVLDIADNGGNPSVSVLSEVAARYRVNIVAGSIADRRGNSVYNTSYIINRKGEVVASYSKIHRFGLMEEDKYLAAGDRVVDFELDGERCGIIICYDLRFPELARTLALRGIKALFVPAEWPNPRMHHWRSLNIARAIENQMFVIGCNRVGGNGTTFFGHSMVTD